MKKTIRLSESDLHKIIKNTVKRVIKENYADTTDYDYFTETQPEYDAEEEIYNMSHKNDDELMDIINGNSNLSDPSFFAGEYDDGFDEVDRIQRAAKDEYMKRHKDYAFKFGKMPYQRDKQWDNYEKNNYNSLEGGNRNIKTRNVKNSSDYDDAELEKFKQNNPDVFDGDNFTNNISKLKKATYNLKAKNNPNSTKSERNKMANFDKQPMNRKGSLNRSVPESRERMVKRIVKESIEKYLKEDDEMLSSSWLNGKYTIPYGYNVEINTGLSYVSIEDANGNEEESYFLQGDEADNLIDEINQYYNSNDVSAEEAINAVIQLYY